MPRLTKRTVEAAPAQATPYFLWCGELPGFGVRVFSSGKRVYYAAYRNADGVRRRMAIGQHGKITTEEARKLAIAILGAVVKGDDPAEERATGRKAITVAQLCDRYLAAAERGLILSKRGAPQKASTRYSDHGRIVRHIKPLLGSKRVRDLVAADIYKFIRDVADGKTATVETTANKRGKAVVTGGPGAAARTTALLSGILTFAVHEGIRSGNPARGVRRPAGQRRQRRLTADEYKELGRALAEAEAHGETWQTLAAVRLLALTGCRLGEIVKLQWSEIDRESHCLRLRDSKTGPSIRPLGKPALAVLAQLERKSDHVFPAIRREQGAFGGMGGGWRRLLRRAGLQGVTLHTLRHSFASVADDLGYTVAAIGALLGHSTGSVTGRYIHKLDDVLIAAADRVAGTIHADLTGGGEDVEKHRRLLQAFFAEPWDEKDATAARDGRPPEPDDGRLWKIALLRADDPSLSLNGAAKQVVADVVRSAHSPEAAVQRLRRKYRENAELLESVVAELFKTRRAS
jgi:integrase